MLTSHALFQHTKRHIPNVQAVRWSEEVVDNEFMNKKKSKSEFFLVCFTLACLWHMVSDSQPCSCAECCIFHKQKSFGDWSDNDSDDECNDCNKQADCGQSDDKQETQS